MGAPASGPPSLDVVAVAAEAQIAATTHAKAT
jgi:hypothetical protein